MSTTTPPPAGPGGPEYLEHGGGEPLGPSGDHGAGGGRRTALVAGGAVAALLAVGGGVWAAMSFFASGPQPSEALPASTVGYASVDLDPSGGQKIEAFRMIEKFPALEKELGGFDADDDILEKVFGDLEDECEGLSYTDDVKPWLGHRFAVAAVDLGERMPTPVGVVQVKDAGAAEDGLSTLRECGGSDVGGWAIDGDWAVIAETDELAEKVVAATSDGTLADDATFQKWNGELGDAGVLNLYASPDAGKLMLEAIGSWPFGAFDTSLTSEGATDMPEQDLPEEMTQALEEFQGMAATLRFDDGALEFEAVGAAGDDEMANLATDRGDDVVSTLPEDTAAAIGFGFPEGWMDEVLERAAAMSGGDMTEADLAAEFEAQTGLTVDDIETLFGESAAVSLSSSIDLETLFNSSDGSDVPIGAKVQGDAAAIQDVVSRLVESLGGPPEAFGTDAEGDLVAIGPNADYRGELLEDGGLGGTDAFQNVVREADQASAVLFVNFDAGDWLTSLAEGDQEAAENLEPLQGLGISTWTTDEGAHGIVRLTTN
ncbi:hypothetical protein [Nocardioides sp.]|uniref:hypothetical protein n=1 Tax=Nocardioides sp. TaxID=35761 RepID=UPI002ED39941